MEGLRTDIRAVVLVQRPPDIDTACSLARLQEEVAEGEIIPAGVSPSYRTHATSYRHHQVQHSRPSTPSAAEDRRATEAARASSDNSRVTALRKFRRAKGLCFKCGERWGKEHTCPQQVLLHVVEELLALFAPEDVMGESEEMFTPPTSPEVTCALSLQAVSGTDAPTVVQIHAWIQGKEALLLVDSGSTTSFINEQLAAQMSNIQDMPRQCKVKVADGSELICNKFILGCDWVTQGHEFKTDFKVIKLGVYDAILGLDWLKQHSPMQIDWRLQHLTVTTDKGSINLQGIHATNPSVQTITPAELIHECKTGAVAHLIHLCTAQQMEETADPNSPVIQQILDRFSHVFTTPTELPPKRSRDHQIPLMQGAQPVNS